MSKDSGRLSRLGVLAPAALSACMDASVLAVPAAGAIVSTVLKELSKAFMLKKWFHGVMSTKEAEHLIIEKGKNGSFLVRESQAHPGEYVLSVRVRDRVSHVMIKRQHDKYDVGSGELFDDLVGLIEHFRSYPMIETSGDVLRLLQPVSGARLRSHYKKRADDLQVKESLRNDYEGSFEGEFQSLKALEERQAFTTIEGMKLENMRKNRYRNILPYDQTRVILRGRGSDSDYINANYVRPYRQWDGSSSFQSSNESLNSVKSLFVNSDTKKTAPLVTKSLSDDALREVKKWFKLDRINGNITNYDTLHDKTYIAAQGCLHNTIGDFWRMIWQEDVRVIAMITNEVERGKKKCAPYWPAAGQEERHAGLLVRAVAETRHVQYVARELAVTDESGHCRSLYHYQFTAWSDHGTPEEPHGLLAFLADINHRMALVSQTNNPPEQNILCVHCSAGVGRTGTFIVLDMLIDNLKYGGVASDGDVFKAVAYTRSQRAGMVQNKTQYQFIYRALHAYLSTHRDHKKVRVYTLDA